MSTEAEQLLEVCKAFISKHQIHSAIEAAKANHAATQAAAAAGAEAGV